MSSSGRYAALVAYLFTVTMLGTTLPTPLYSIYSADLGFSPFTVTIVFAVYAVGVLATLLVLGRLSDHIGRRAVLVLAVGLSAVSAVVFMTTENLPALIVGRAVSGVSAGLVTGAATAYLAELEADRPQRAAVLSTVANMGGLGLGPLVAGVLAEHLTHPLVLPFAADLVLLTPVVLVPLLGLPETVDNRDGWRTGVAVQRLSVPADIRRVFVAASLAALAAFSLLGFTTALIGQVLGEGLDDHSRQSVGVVSFLLFATAAAAQVVAGRMPAEVANRAGLTLLPLGAALIVISVYASSLWLLIAGALVGGVGVGWSFRSALGAVTRVAPADRRGEVISAFFAVGYAGLTVPVLGAGVLVTATTLRTAVLAVAIFVVALAITSAGIVRSLADADDDRVPDTRRGSPADA